MALFIPCSSKPNCTEELLTNVSSERADSEVFVGVYFPPINPPLNRTFIGEACGSVCESLISQEDANLCAAAHAQQCIMEPPSEPPPVVNPPPTNPPVVPPPEPPVVPPVNPPGTTPCNNPQTACVQCPDGTEFCYTVPRCTFFAATLAEADAIALSYAQAQAAAKAMCITGVLGDGCTGQPYLSEFSVTGGVQPITWAIIAGTLPAGITTSITDSNRRFVFSGVPSTKGIFPITVRVEDANGTFFERSDSMSIVALGESQPPDGEIGVPYSFQFLAAGGIPPFTFALTNGALPPGLTITSTGLLSGTPTTNGHYDFTISATDQTPVTCPKECSMNIGSVCEITNNFFLPNAQVEVAYTVNLITTLTGVGNGECHWTLVGGTLPPGLTLLLLGQGADCHGVLTGTPPLSAVDPEGDNPTHQDYEFTVRVTDANDSTRSCQKDLFLRVTNPCGTLPINASDIEWSLGHITSTGNISEFTIVNGALINFNVNSAAAGGDPNLCFGSAAFEGTGGICNARGGYSLTVRFTVTGNVHARIPCTPAPESLSEASFQLTSNAGSLIWINRIFSAWRTGDNVVHLPGGGPISGVFEAEVIIPAGPISRSFFLQVRTAGGSSISGTFELIPSSRPPTVP